MKEQAMWRHWPEQGGYKPDQGDHKGRPYYGRTGLGSGFVAE